MKLDTLSVALIYLCLPWLFVEVASQVLRHLPSRQGSAVLSIRKRSSKDAKKVWISRGPLWIKIETVSLNEVPGHLLRQINRLWRLAPERDVRPSRNNSHTEWEANSKSQLCRQAQTSLEILYDAGTLFAGVALIGSIVFLIWGAFDLIGQISQLGGSESDQLPNLQKRDAEGLFHDGPKEQSWSPSLVPLIPGLTLPLNHIYPLVLALSLTQLIHEAGHAICGTLQSWTPLRMGLVVLFPCIPGAFVVLPVEAIAGEENEEEEEFDSSTNEREQKGRMMRKRLRNISAGVWHNAITAMLLFLVIYSGIGKVMHEILWRDANGMRVESVDASSPLLQHMPTGTIISRLNDFDLIDTVQLPAERQIAWDSYLLQNGAQKQERIGWCVPLSAWDGQSVSCCDALNSESPNQVDNPDVAAPSTSDGTEDLLCFQALFASPTNLGRCYDPIRLVSSISEKKRCSSKCTGDEICIAPDEREQLIRIKVTRSMTKNSRVVLFQGSPVSIYSALTVTAYEFRWQWIGLPYHIFRWWNLLVSYLLNLSLAMALLNMLPLPSLDGDVYLGFVLAALVSRFHKDTQTDVEDFEDEEEVITGIQLGDVSRVTSRPDSPTNFRRPSVRQAVISNSQRQSFLTRTSQHTSNFRVQAKIQERFRWCTIGLAVFVFGGSILLHAIKQS